MNIRNWFRPTSLGIMMIAIIAIIMITVLFLILHITQENQFVPINTSDNHANSSTSSDVFDFKTTATIIAAVIAGTVTAFFAPAVKDYFERKNQFTSKYVDWCIEIHGAIFEFSELCSKIKREPYPPSTLLSPDSGFNNPTYVISHLWEMHRAVEKGYKWLGMIWQDDPDTYNKFNKLFDKVDYLWHYVEDVFEPRFYDDQETSDNLRKILQKISGDRKYIASQIHDAIYDDSDFNANRFEPIKQFLDNKIPMGIKRSLQKPKPLLPQAVIMFPDDKSIISECKSVYGTIIGADNSKIKVIIDKESPIDIIPVNGEWLAAVPPGVLVKGGTHTVKTVITDTNGITGTHKIKFKIQSTNP